MDDRVCKGQRHTKAGWGKYSNLLFGQNTLEASSDVQRNGSNSDQVCSCGGGRVENIGQEKDVVLGHHGDSGTDSTRAREATQGECVEPEEQIHDGNC